MPAAESKNSVLTKTIEVLDVFSASSEPLRFTDLIYRTGLPKATLHRILSVLVEERLLRFDNTSKLYRPGIRLITWAHNTWHSLDIRNIAADEMKRLGELTNETIHLAVLDGERIVYIDKHESSQQVRMYSAVGKTAPLHCTGVGKVIVAFLEPGEREALVGRLSFDRYTDCTITDPRSFTAELERIRADGFGRDEREHEDEIRCIAAPVLDHRGRSVAGISISAPAYRISDDKVDQWLPRLLESVRKVSESYARIHH